MISVIIPTKNRSEELQRAILSVINQTHQDFEIFVVDDHSEENILEVVESFNDSRIIYLKSHKTPSNANVCRNIGMQNASGEYVAMLDSDDEWLQEHLELGLKEIERRNLDGVFGGFILDDGVSQKKIWSRQRKENEKMVNYLLSDGVAVTPSHIYKTKCCKSIEWDENLLRHQDYDFSVKFAGMFNFQNSQNITCIVHWVKNNRRKHDFKSNQIFIERNKADILPIIYNKYHRDMYLHIQNSNEKMYSEFENHYLKHSLHYFGFISLSDFITVKGNSKNVFSKFLLRIEFAIRTIIKA
jgi:glycosyltransferase involved in cell wall biosynthesis